MCLCAPKYQYCWCFCRLFIPYNRVRHSMYAHVLVKVTHTATDDETNTKHHWTRPFSLLTVFISNALFWVFTSFNRWRWLHGVGSFFETVKFKFLLGLELTIRFCILHFFSISLQIFLMKNFLCYTLDYSHWLFFTLEQIESEYSV